jgi:LysM repeat protein
MRSGFILSAFFLLSLGTYAQEKMTAEQYIETYKDIAIAEMKRTGIPASITLAQGLIESGSGNSSLSRQSNNHFGIKCKKDWTGRSVNFDDDAPQECFRAYDRVEDSYRDHSDFIRAGERYAFLFELDPTDYKGWANGLKQAGYATNPQYADMLITAIERYSLYQYDIGNKRKPITPDGRQEKEPLFASNSDNELTSFNGIPAYESKAGNTYVSIAENNYMMRWEVAKYNDLKKGEELEPGTILYLKPKLRKGKEAYHVVKEGESMYYISQLHAIKLKMLYKWNRMKPGEEPAVGEKLYLRQKRDNPPALTNNPAKKKGLKRPDPEKERHDVIEPVKETKAPETHFDPSAETPAVVHEEAADQSPAPVYHTVQAGETLYSISRKYGVTVDEIKTKNNLTDNTLSINQKLLIR